MAIVKFVTSGRPMNNIFPYVTRDEATEARLIDGVNCSPETALEEFQFVKRQFHKEDGRMYYHIIQSFSPDDELTPETAHEIGLRFAEAFPGYQILVATHVNTGAIHNHLIMNSVSFEDGRKFHQTRDEMLEVKEYSNQLCLEYGLSVTEPKSKGGRRSKAKAELVQTALYAMAVSSCKEEFIRYMEEHGYRVKWEDDHKYITFTTPDNVRHGRHGVRVHEAVSDLPDARAYGAAIHDQHRRSADAAGRSANGRAFFPRLHAHGHPGAQPLGEGSDRSLPRA